MNPGHVLIQKLVSDPLPVAQTISGTLDWVITAQESSASQNAFNQLHVYVLREPDTLVGTLLNNYAELSTSTNEWPTSPLGRGPAGGTPATLTAVAAQAGDRIVAGEAVDDKTVRRGAVDLDRQRAVLGTVSWPWHERFAVDETADGNAH